MAIANSDVTVTADWVEISTSDTGDFVFYNEATPQSNIHPLGSKASEAIRWAFSPTGVTPTCRGNIVYPGDAFSRGSVVGYIWVRTDSGKDLIYGQKAE